MFGSRLYAAVARGTRVQIHGLQHSTQLSATAIVRVQTTIGRRAFAIPAKPKKGSSAESSSKRPRVKKAPSAASAAASQTKKRATAERAAAKKQADQAAAKKRSERLAARKQADREKRDKKKAREQARKLKARTSKPKKVLTPEQAARKKLRDDRADLKVLKAAALSPPTRFAYSAWHVFNADFVKSRLTSGSSSTGTRSAEEIRSTLSGAVKEAGQAYRNLSPDQRESWNHAAREQSTARASEYEAWLKSHTPQQIVQANIARRRLRTRENAARNHPTKWPAIEDGRIPKSPLTPYIQFFQERQASGDLTGIAQSESTKLIAQEWKDLSDASKQPYVDTYNEQKEEYVKAHADATGIAPGTRVSTPDLEA